MINRPTRLSIDFVKHKFAENGFVLLDGIYINNSTPMLCKCSNGHVIKMTYAKCKIGYRCRHCSYPNRPQCAKKYSCEEVKNIFAKHGCVLLSEYRVIDDELIYRCRCNRIATTSIYSFLKGKQCTSCAKKGANNPAWIADRKSVAERKYFRSRCQTLVRNTLKSVGKKKKSKTVDILGYTGEDLRDYFATLPMWESIKEQRWHIDHIFPVVAFIEHGITDLSIINCLRNLRPLLARDNLRKSRTYDVIEFQNWLKKNYPVALQNSAIYLSQDG